MNHTAAEGRYYVGRWTPEGGHSRFWQSLTPEEYAGVVGDDGLPAGLWSIFVPAGLNVENSDICRLLRDMPIIMRSSVVLGEVAVDTLTAIREAREVVK